MHLSSDDIRNREKRRRRAASSWQAASVALHVLLLFLLMFVTPVRELVLPEEKKPASNPAEDLSADRIEEIAERLEMARINELLRQLQALQTILHNMDVLKEQIQKDYDHFAEESALTAKERIKKIIDTAEQEQLAIVTQQTAIQQTAAEFTKRSTPEFFASKENAQRAREEASRLENGEALRVSTAQSNSQNALYRIQSESEFVGYKKAAETAKLLRELQLEAAKVQSAAQNQTIQTQRKAAERYEADSRVAAQEKAIADRKETSKKIQENLQKLRAEKETKTAELRQLEKQLSENRRQAETRWKEKKAADEALKTKEASIRKLKQEKKQSEASAQEKELPALRKHVNDKRIAAETLDRKNKTDERDIQNRKNDLSRRERQIATEQRRRNEIHWQMPSQENKLQEYRNWQAGVMKVFSEKRTEDSEKKLAQAKSVQQQLNDSMKKLRAALEEDVPKPEKLTAAPRVENEMTLRSTRNMDMEQSYEFAKALEQEITHTFKDLKATQTAIQTSTEFHAAQKLTDVATPVRREYPPELRADKVRTKEALDTQKSAQVKVVAEVNNMVDTTLAMLQEAMEIVMRDEEMPEHAQQQAANLLQWMTEEAFAERKSQEAKQQRMQQIIAVANLALEVQQAAAEDENVRMKDMASLMATAPAPLAAKEKNEPEVPSEVQPKVTLPPPPVETVQMPAVRGVGKDLVPGNILRTVTDSGDGIPATWMFVNSWYVIGPFPNPNRENLLRKFPPESVVDLDAAYIGKDGRTVRWEYDQALNALKNRASRSRITPRSSEEYGIWYAYAEIFVDRECDRWIAVGSDDRSDIWLNEVKIWASSNQLKSWNIGEGFRRVHFKKGRNKILVRLENGHFGMGWSFCVSTGEKMPATL